MGIFLLSLYTPPPPGAIGPFLNGIFPASAPSVGGSWELEDPLPGIAFPSPVRILPFPGSTDVLVLSKMGEIWRVSLESRQRSKVLDIKDRSFKAGEAGTVGMVLHPHFGDPAFPGQQLVFVFYRSKPEPDKWSEEGFNRLSKFQWNEATQSFDAASEEILIQQYDRSSWHNGGAMFFGPDGFLYLSLGDEGHEPFRKSSTQQLTGGLFSGIIRIDVDNDANRSHPIRRQPRSEVAAPAGWGATFSQGYSIPDDNPWLSPDGSRLEEFYAIGLRSPYSMYYDAETAQIWVADVGSSKREEVNLVERGDNLQWPFMEGTLELEGYTRPDNLIGTEKAVYFEYDRSVGSCIIGGSIYRGTLFPELNGKYLFADYINPKLMALTKGGSNAAAEYKTLLSLEGQSVEMPENSGVTGLFALENGQILVTVQGEDYEETGKIFRLKRKADVPEPPARLSQLGVFSDLQTLTPVAGLIPYSVNAPLWSDRALKQRWIALPNDGDFDSPAERINFEGNKEWTFPEGTVFVKHFELPLDTEPGAATARLETRFFIIGANGQAYGLTYKWNAEGTEAFLLGGGDSRDFEIETNGQPAFSQRWEFPSREQCMSCHNANARFVLGVKTQQLNGELFYPELGRSKNQLEYLNEKSIFQRDIGSPAQYLRSYSIEDENADLELRVRSYLDANCASCHRLGGVPTSRLDLRLNIPLVLQNVVNIPTASSNSDPNHLIVKPGDHAESELWIRDAGTDDNRMPPIGRSLVDQTYVDVLAEWIDGLPEDSGKLHELLIFPNPTKGSVSIRISDDWSPPYRLRVFTLSGGLLHEESSDSRSLYVDLGQQAAGIYLLEVSNSSNRHTERIVVK